jgi:hypothetical protein
MSKISKIFNSDYLKKIAQGLTITSLILVIVGILVVIGLVYLVVQFAFRDGFETVYIPSEQNVGALVPRPDLDAFSQISEEDDPLEMFDPPARMLSTDPLPVEALDGSMDYRNLYSGFIPSMVADVPRLEYNRIVPYNRDSLEYIWNQNVKHPFRHSLIDRQKELIKPAGGPTGGGPVKPPTVVTPVSPPVTPGKPTVTPGKPTVTPGDGPGKPTVTPGGGPGKPTVTPGGPPTVTPGGGPSGPKENMDMVEENNDRDMVGCPKVFPVLNGAYQKIYVMSGTNKDGNLVYEFYGRSKAEARMKFRSAFPGCKLPAAIDVTTLKAEVPSSS